ncbi:MAG: hypothetical protein NZZ41_03545 [Candidatus Dojkabacteria bacterium]|nr:hypothetical protein [Candidatus Dojkabacteria bacterium]
MVDCIYIGIIYKVVQYANGNKLVHLLTKEGTNIHLLFKKREKTQKYFDIEIGTLVEIKSITNNAIKIFKSSSTINLFYKWKNTAHEILILNYLCEIISIFANYSSSENNIYKIFIELLNMQESNNKLLLTTSVILKVLDLFGLLKLKHELDNLLELSKNKNICISIDENEATYVIRNQGVKYNTHISTQILKIQKMIITQPLEFINRINLDTSILKNLVYIHTIWIKNVTGKNMKTVPLLLNVFFNHSTKI